MPTRKPARKTAALPPVAIWYDAAHDTIHLAARNAFVTTVHNDPKSKRGHPQLFAKLAACLKAAGVPHPDAVGELAKPRQRPEPDPQLHLRLRQKTRGKGAAAAE